MGISAVMIDQREPEHIQKQFPDAAVTLLDVGDAWVACEDGHILQIERKTSNDLLSSIRDGRLFNQIARLVDPRINQQLKGERQTYWPYLVITGGIVADRNGNVWAERETGWSWNSLQGALLTVAEMGCYIVYCRSDSHYAETVMMLAKRERKIEVDILPQKVPIPIDAKTAFLMGLPGIGVERAQHILEWSNGVLAHALTGLVDLNIKAPIGETIRKTIRGFLGLDHQETIELKTTEVKDV